MSPAFPKPEPKAKKARQGLKRTRLKRKSARRISRKSDEERAFLEWLHKQECCAKGISFVMGTYNVTHWCFAGMQYDGAPPVQAAHFRDHTGASLKESDLTAIPLCNDLHDDYDGRRTYFFKGWPLEAKKDWHRLRQAETREKWEASKRSVERE